MAFLFFWQILCKGFLVGSQGKSTWFYLLLLKKENSFPSLVRPRRFTPEAGGGGKEREDETWNFANAFLSSCIFTPFPACGGIPLKTGQVNAPERLRLCLATVRAELEKEERNKDQTVTHSNR